MSIGDFEDDFDYSKVFSVSLESGLDGSEVMGTYVRNLPNFQSDS